MSSGLFDEYGVENCYIELIELFPCKSKDELKMRENHYIRSLVCVNKNRAIITPEERKEYVAEYYEKNKEEILRQKAEYREKNKEIINRKQNERYTWKVISSEFRAILNEC